jgi:murein DD-endopeptidase MepM/ murein hydrolase activator NlpD
MRLIPSVQPLRVLLGLGGGVGLAAFFLGHPEAAPMTVGRLTPVYAAPAEWMNVVSLKMGETLGEVLDGALDYTQQQAVLAAFQERASERRLDIGTEVTLRYRTSDNWLRGVDIGLNADSAIRITRDVQGWRSEIAVTPLWSDTLFLSGPIETSLWSAVVGHPALEGLSDQERALLIDQLESVYEYQIDFSTQIQPGDYYRFAAERKLRPDGSMHSSGRILAAEMVNAGKSYHAVWFVPQEGGLGSYYDLEGKSLRGLFLINPVQFRYISSRFSNARRHPILGTWRAHRGVDYSAASGTPVRATADGVIVSRGRSGNYGNLIELRHANGYTTRYAHLQGFAPGQSVGSRVSQSEIIGYVGMTGLATGPHLHYEMYRNGQVMNPQTMSRPGGAPIPSNAMDRFSTELIQRQALLAVLPGPGDSRYASHVSGARPSSAAAMQAQQRSDSTRAGGGD